NSITPTSTPVGSGQTTLTLFGSGFSPGAIVQFGIYPVGISSYVSANQVSVVIPAQYLTTAQTVQVSISGSNSVPFVIGTGSTGTLSISCSPSNGPTAINVFYQQTCSESGGTSPFTWTISGLPAGLTSAFSNSSSVTISGVPSSPQSYSYS